MKDTWWGTREPKRRINLPTSTPSVRCVRNCSKDVAPGVPKNCVSYRAGFCTSYECLRVDTSPPLEYREPPGDLVTPRPRLVIYGRKGKNEASEPTLKSPLRYSTFTGVSLPGNLLRLRRTIAERNEGRERQESGRRTLVGKFL